MPVWKIFVFGLFRVHFRRSYALCTCGKTIKKYPGLHLLKINCQDIFLLIADQSVDASSTSMGTTVFTVSAHDNDSSTVTYYMKTYPVTPDLFAVDTGILIYHYSIILIQSIPFLFKWDLSTFLCT